MSVIIGADIVPTESNSVLFKNGDISALVGCNLKNLFAKVDYKVFNLETPLADDMTPIAKVGRALHAECSTIAGMKKIGIDLFTLANNHIMDQGPDGLDSTINVLNKNKIAFLGAGNNLADAKKTFLADVNGRKIGFYACAEHEFSIASNLAPGANPFDVLESFDHVSSLKSECDFAVVLYHGGKEHYQYPSPMLQKVCRKFVEKGADLVVCQHSHCIGCEEKYEKGTIVYGQGNFLFDSNHGPYSDTSLLINLNDDFSIEYLPLVKVENGVRLALDDNAEKIMNAFKIRSEQIKEDGFVIKEYKKFASSMLKNYLQTCSGYNHSTLRRILNRLTGGIISKRIVKSYNKKDLLAICNYIECEAHRELFLTGIKNAFH